MLLLHNEEVRRKNSSARLKAPKMTSENVQLVCEPCGVTAGSQVAMDMHLAGIKHMKRINVFRFSGMPQL